MLRLLLTSFAVLALGLVPTTAAAAFPGANGLIVFESTSGGLQTIGADGQGLASIPGTLGLYSPVFSPGGKRLAAGTSGGLATLDLSGANLALVGTAGGAPAWSPDGTRLAYTNAGDIWTVNADGSGIPVQLTSGPDFDLAPSWSATGRIAFVRNGVGSTQVWSMAADGGDIRQVSTIGDVEADRPAWSPDGTKLAFGIDDGMIVDVYVSDTTVPPSLANDKRITVNGSSAIFNGRPSWSPDGTRIAFASNRTGVSQIWTTTAPGGGGEVQVTTTGGRRSDWQPLVLPPQNTSLPVAAGTAVVGGLLTCETGAWTGSPTGFAISWLRDGGPISGESGPTYAVTAADRGTTISCRVIAANLGGDSEPATSAGQAIPPAVPQNTSLPVAAGTAVVGGLLTCETGVWTGSPTGFAISWLRDGGPISGESGPTYAVTAADRGTTISCRVIAANLGGDSEPATSAGQAIPPAPTPTPTTTPIPPLTPTATLPPLAMAVAPASVGITRIATLPPAKACVNRHKFLIRLRDVRANKIVRAQIKLNGKQVRNITGKALSLPIDLRGLLKGRFNVEIITTDAAGKRLIGNRTYRTCAPKRR